MSTRRARTSDGPGALRIQKSAYSSSTRRVTVADGVSTAQATLSGCTATAPPPPPPPPPPPSTLTGGANAGVIVFLNGLAPPGGALASLSSSSPAVSPLPTVLVPAGQPTLTVQVPTSPVAATTPVTMTARWNGVTVAAPLTLSPSQPPATLTLNPTTTTGNTGSNGVVTISVTGAGVAKSALLTVNPFPAAPIAAPSLLSPTNGARIARGQTVPFDWSDVPGAAGYIIQVSTSSTFSTTVAAFSTATLPVASLFWRVRASDACNAGSWSATGTLRVK